MVLRGQVGAEMPNQKLNIRKVDIATDIPGHIIKREIFAVEFVMFIDERCPHTRLTDDVFEITHQHAREALVVSANQMIFHVNEKYLMLNIVTETNVKMIGRYFPVVWMILKPVF